MLKYALIVACVSCCMPKGTQHASPQECVSQCGMLFQGFDNGSMSCEQLQEAENETLAEYNKSVCKEDPRFCIKNSCKALFGWQIRTEDAVAWTEDGMDFAVGMSSCRTKEMDLGENTDWRHGSFPHELAHVIQDCQPPSTWQETKAESERGSGHAGWAEHGIDAVISKIRSK